MNETALTGRSITRTVRLPDGPAHERGTWVYARDMVGHWKANSAGSYDRRNDDVSVAEVERIGILQEAQWQALNQNTTSHFHFLQQMNQPQPR